MSSLRIVTLAVLLLGASLLASLVAPSRDLASSSPTPVASSSPASDGSADPSPSALPSATPSSTPQPTATPLPSATVPPSSAPTATPKPTPSPTPTSTPTPTPPPTPTPTPKPAGTSLASLLARLSVTDETQFGSYDRDRFRHWVDADGDGCDARDEVLIAEAISAPSIGEGCTLLGGRWRSAYDNLETTDPSTFDIDHVVALKEAWVSGAAAWSDARREAFANDLDAAYALIAVSASTNRSKSDQDPAEWLPPVGAYRCTYIAHWLAVKVRWSLSVNYSEYLVLNRYAGECPAFPGEVVLAP